MINLNLKSPELAEFIGILIGDGFIGSYGVTIFGKQKVLKWKGLIGSSNPYHIGRINASVA